MNPSNARRNGPGSGLRARWLLGLGLLALTGCQFPTFEGAHIQVPLPGFRRVPNAPQERKMFPAWESVHYEALVNASWGELSTIHINGYPGTMMRADVQTALEDAINTVLEPVTFSGVQEITIDGRTAWGWAERLRSDVGLEWIAYRVAIPYDTITYTLDLYSGDPAYKNNPDTLLALAATFGIGKVTWNIPLILGISVVLIILISTVRKRARQKAIRLQSITLKKVEIKKKEEEGEKDEGSQEERVGDQLSWSPERNERERPAADDPESP